MPLGVRRVEMPVYEYLCLDCGHEFDMMVKYGEDDPTCGRCAGEHVKMMLSKCNFNLKGGGWYKDGYSKQKGAKEGED